MCLHVQKILNECDDGYKWMPCMYACVCVCMYVCVCFFMCTNMECKCGMYESNLYIALFSSIYLTRSTFYGSCVYEKLSLFHLHTSHHRAHTLRFISLSKSHLSTIRNIWRMKNYTAHSCRDFINWCAIISMSWGNSSEVKTVECIS